MDSDYPSTVIEVLDDSMRFNGSALKALQKFAAAGPWRGSMAERRRRFRTLNKALATAYGIREPDLVFGSGDGGSHYDRSSHRIVIAGKLSVVTFLHEFSHAREMGERDACRWSINLFRRCFPQQYGRLVHVGHMLMKPKHAARRDSGR